MANASISIQLANNTSVNVSGEIAETEATTIASTISTLLADNTKPAPAPVV